jgi:hypothetical protein
MKFLKTVGATNQSTNQPTNHMNPVKLVQICILLLVGLLGLFPNDAAGITPPNCSQLLIEVKKLTNPPSCATDECGRMYFQVALRTQSYQIQTTNQIDLPYISILTDIQILAASAPAGSATFSKVNKKMTESCLGPLGSGFMISADPITNIVSFMASNDNEAYPITMNLVGDHYEFIICTIVVDAFAGESLTPVYPSNLANPPTNKSCAYTFWKINGPAQSQTTCYLPLVISPDLIIGQTGYPTPSFTSDSKTCLQFGTFDAVNGELSIDLNNISSTPQTVGNIDFLFSLTASSPMTAPTVKCGGLPVPPTTVSGNIYTFRIQQTSLPLIPTGSFINLCKVSVSLPIPANLKTTLDFHFIKGVSRYGGNGNIQCFNACLGPDKSIQIGSDDFCSPNNFTFRVTGLNEDGLGCIIPPGCGVRIAKVEIDWDAALPPTLLFKQIKFKVDFGLSGTLHIVSTATPNCGNTLSCPAQNNPIACSTCLAVNNSSIQFCASPATPMSVTRGSALYVRFEGLTGCIQSAIFTEASVWRSNATSPCVPKRAVVNLPLCNPEIAGKITEESDVHLQSQNYNVIIKKVSGGCADVSTTADCADYSICTCVPNAQYNVTPISNDANCLDGINMFDVVRMSKHILNIQPFTSPYEYLAADVNNNQVVTTADIQELRKLILGIYTCFPVNASWRFFPANVLLTIPPETATPLSVLPKEMTITAPSSNVNFKAVKIGDITGDHAKCGSRSENLLKSNVFIPNTTPAKKSSLVQIPIRQNGNEAWEATQLAFRFDPNLWEFVGISAGDVIGVNDNSFGLTKVDQGEIRFAWFDVDAENWIQPNQIIAWITLQAKTNIAKSNEPILSIDDNILPNQSWEDNGKTYSLLNQPIQTKERTQTDVDQTPFLEIKPITNPFSDQLNLVVQAEKAQMGSIWVFNSMGQRVFWQEISLLLGENTLYIPNTSSWPRGVFMVKLHAGKETIETRVVKL